MATIERPQTRKGVSVALLLLPLDHPRGPIVPPAKNLTAATIAIAVAATAAIATTAINTSDIVW